MVKKLISLSAGVAMMAVAIAPVFATNTENATTNVDITSSITLDILNATPFGVGYDIDPSSGTTSTRVRAGAGAGGNTTSTLTMFTNNSTGGVIKAKGSVANAGFLKSGANSIPNVGSGADLEDVGGCLSSGDDTNATGLAIRAVTLGSSASFKDASGAVLATKFGADTDDTTRLWCHLVAADKTLAKTVGFDNPDTGTNLVVDYLVGVKASGTVPVASYSEVITYTATVNL